MSHDNSAIKLWLLDLIFQQDVQKIRQGSCFKEREWHALEKMAIAHRLCPLIHWRLTHACQGAWVPEKLRTTCANSFKASALRSLQIQAEIATLHKMLEENNLSHVFLKGAWLAFHAYPHEALRPLRDLDVLLPRSKINRAYELLISAGYLPKITQNEASLEASIQLHKHLPPLISPQGLSIELHHRLYNPSANSANSFELSESDSFWKNTHTEPWMELRLTYLSPEQLLVHLIVHAVYDHQFTNGPLVISDLIFTIENHDINWDVFWDFARRGGHTRGAALVFKMIQLYSPMTVVPLPADIDKGDIDDQLLEEARLLMLGDLDSMPSFIALSQLDKSNHWSERINFIFNRVLFPSRARLATQYGVYTDSNRIYFYYVAKWLSVLRTHSLPLLRSIFKQGISSDVSRLRRINGWLAR